MAVTFHSASNSGYQTGADHTWTHSPTEENILVVAVAMLDVGETVDECLYDDIDPLTFLGAQSSAAGRIEFWGMIHAIAGPVNVSVSLTSAVPWVAAAVSVLGGNESFPFDDGFVSAQATNVGAADATVNLTTTVDGSLVVGAVSTTDGSVTVGAGQTERANISDIGGSGVTSTEPAATAGSITTSFTGIGAAQTWAVGAVSVRAEEAPVITSNGGGATANISVQENETVDYVVTTLTSDLSTADVSYTIVGGDDQGRFSLDSNSGELSFASIEFLNGIGPVYASPEDADTNNTYVVTVRATNDPGSLFDEQEITVTITSAVAIPVFLNQFRQRWA